MIYDSITVENADTQNSTPPAEEEGDGANSSFSEATDEDNLVVGGLHDWDEGDVNGDEEMIESWNKLGIYAYIYKEINIYRRLILPADLTGYLLILYYIL